MRKSDTKEGKKRSIAHRIHAHCTTRTGQRVYVRLLLLQEALQFVLVSVHDRRLFCLRLPLQYSSLWHELTDEQEKSGKSKRKKRQRDA
jgi:hypothetical protein